MGQLATVLAGTWNAKFAPTTGTSSDMNASTSPNPRPTPTSLVTTSMAVGSKGAGVFLGMEDPLMVLLLKILCYSVLVLCIVATVSKTLELMKGFVKNVVLALAIVGLVLAIVVPNLPSLTTVVCGTGVFDVLPVSLRGWTVGLCATSRLT